MSHTRGTLRPVYGKHTLSWRIAYMANGLWALQRRGRPQEGGSGWIDMECGLRDLSHWYTWSRPTRKEVAEGQLKIKDLIAEAVTTVDVAA